MIEIKCEHDIENRRKIYTIILPDDVLGNLKLDDFDMRVIADKVEHGSDILQSLQIIAFRYEQQFGSRKTPETGDGDDN